MPNTGEPWAKVMNAHVMVINARCRQLNVQVKVKTDDPCECSLITGGSEGVDCPGEGRGNERSGKGDDRPSERTKVMTKKQSLITRVAVCLGEGDDCPDVGEECPGECPGGDECPGEYPGSNEHPGEGDD